MAGGRGRGRRGHARDDRPRPPLPPAARTGERLDVLRALQDEWAAHVLERLRSLSQQLGRPFVWLADAPGGSLDVGVNGALAAAPAAAASGGATEQGADGSAAAAHVYDPAELLERILAINHPNHSSRYTGLRRPGAIALELAHPSVSELADALRELATARQVGVDDELRSWFHEERQRVGTHVLSGGHVPLVSHYARTGVPSNLRARVWQAALDATRTARTDREYAALQAEVRRVELLTDASVRADVRAALDDEAFFVFADLLEEVTLALVRDPWVAQRAAHTTVPPIRALAAGSEQHEPPTSGGAAAYHFPPSGIIPFRGLASFACPLCYLCGSAAELYPLLRAMWARYWCYLHTFSAAGGTLLPLLKLFEGLLHEAEPRLFHHLAQIGAHPTELAFDWLVFAFVGYLEVDQVLLLWDRVIGYDSLDVLALAAAALLRFRRDALMAAASEHEVADVLEDVSNVKIVPLMQELLVSHAVWADGAGPQPAGGGRARQAVSVTGGGGAPTAATGGAGGGNGRPASASASGGLGSGANGR